MSHFNSYLSTDSPGTKNTTNKWDLMILRSIFFSKRKHHSDKVAGFRMKKIYTNYLSNKGLIFIKYKGNT